MNLCSGSLSAVNNGRLMGVLFCFVAGLYCRTSFLVSSAMTHKYMTLSDFTVSVSQSKRSTDAHPYDVGVTEDTVVFNVSSNYKDLNI